MSEKDKNSTADKSVDISLDMKQVAIAAFATGLIVGIIVTGAIFMTTGVSEDIDSNQDSSQDDINIEYSPETENGSPEEIDAQESGLITEEYSN